jgi:hypothetical protein
MAIGADQHDGTIARDSVDILARGEALLGPVGFDPAAADERLACRESLCGFADNTDKFGDGFDLVEVERLFALANAVEVGVGVGEAGIEEGAAEIDCLGGGAG